MLTELLNKLKTWFFQAPKRYLDGPNGAKELPGSEREILWIIPRSELVHRVFDFPPAVLDNNKDAALQLQLSGWAPFDDAKFAVHWAGPRASVFAWDGPRQTARKNAVLGASQRVRFVPAAFIEQPLDNGCRLLEHQTGYEAQHWQDGSIAASRWWPSEPASRDLEHFFRGAKVPSIVLQAERVEPRSRPWHHTPGVLDQTATVLGDSAVVRYACFATLGVFGFLVGQYVVLTAGETYIRQSLSADQSYFADLREQRRDAIISRQEVITLKSLEDRTPQVRLYDEALKVIAERPVRLLIWTYVPSRLTVTLRADEPMNPTEFITEFEASPFFANVLATTVGRDQDLRIEMDIVNQVSEAGV